MCNPTPHVCHYPHEHIVYIGSAADGVKILLTIACEIRVIQSHYCNQSQWYMRCGCSSCMSLCESGIGMARMYA